MTSNSEKMSIEDKLVEFLKNQGMSVLVSDDMALTELATKAINDAVFKDRKVPNPNRGGWNSPDYLTKPSIVMEAAQRTVEEATRQVMPTVVESLVRDEGFLATLRTAAMLSILGGIPSCVQDFRKLMASDISMGLNRAILNTDNRGNAERMTYMNDLANNIVSTVNRISEELSNTGHLTKV